MKNIYILVIILFLSISCSNETNMLKDNIKGFWVIDTLYYMKNDLRLDCPMDIIEFKKDKVLLPISDKYKAGYFNSDAYGQWSIINNDTTLSIKFKTINPIFKGNNKLFFYDDRKIKRLKMKLVSDSLILVATKLLYDYRDKWNIKSRKKLEDICKKNIH